MSRADASPEPDRIRAMFDGIASSYDRLNGLMTAGLHHRWREMAVLLAQVDPGDSVLDVCCGTGDLAFALRRAVGREGRVVGVDFSEAMLDVARDKCGKNQLFVDFRRADVLNLPFADGAREGAANGSPEVLGCDTTLGPGVGVATPETGAPTGPEDPRWDRGFDACTVGFGIRNVSDVVRAFSEMRRVCRTGGRVVCLEISQSGIPVFKQFYRLWFDHTVPVLGRLAAGELFAYKYLPASVKRFPLPRELSAMMEEAGLRNPRIEVLAGGIITIHHAVV